MKKIVKVFTTALMVASMVMVLLGCSSDNEQIKVKTADVKIGQLEAVYTITGVLVPAQAADISTSLMGKVAEVNVNVGDTVSAGQVLARLDTSQLNAQLNQAQANYQGMQSTQKQAKINLDNAVANLERSKALFGEGAVAKVQLDADQKAYDLAKSQYESTVSSGTVGAKASVENIGVLIQNSIIKSPISGLVLNKSIDVGETATIGSPLMSIADMSSLKLKGTVPQNALPYINKNDQVNLFVDIYPDVSFTGNISEIGSMSVSTGTYFPVEISLPNADKLVPGVSAHADIKVTGDKHLVVPVSAIVENNGEDYLFVIKDGIAKKITVVTGLKNDKEVEIIKGLKDGDTVAVTNANHLFDDMPVQIMKD